MMYGHCTATLAASQSITRRRWPVVDASRDGPAGGRKTTQHVAWSPVGHRVVGATVIRRRRDRWQVTVYAGVDPVTGRERRVTRSVAAKPGQKGPSREARELEARLLIEVGAGDHRNATVTVTQLLEQWLEQAGPDLSPTTLHGYERYIARSIGPRIGNVRLCITRKIYCVL